MSARRATLPHFKTDIFLRWWSPWPERSLREIEAGIWPWRLVCAGAAMLLLALPHTRVAGGPLVMTAGGYAVGYALLRRSELRCPWFCLLLLAADLTAITAMVVFTGGVQSVFAFMYLFPVAVMAVARGTWAAGAVATLALALHTATLGGHALLAGAPRDTAALVIMLYGSAILVGHTHALIEEGHIALTRRLTSLHEGIVRLGRDDSIAEVLEQSIALGVKITGARYGAVSIWDEGGATVHFVTAGLDPGVSERIGAPPHGAGLLGYVRDAATPIRLADPRAHPAASPLPPGHPELGSFLGVPIPTLGGWKGAYYLSDKRDQRGFTADDEHVGSMLAAHVASAVTVRRLAASQREMHDSLLEMLVHICDTREHALAGHSARVSAYARELGARAGLQGEDLQFVATAGLLHDIGKIGIPDGVLGKPGPLDDAERAVMMTHAALGAAIIARAGPLAKVAPLVRHHHERWDGRGYPDGLKGEAIPLGARIVALADMLDASTSDRPYRAGQTWSATLREISRHAGTQFDPTLAALARDMAEQSPPRPEASNASAGGPAETLAEAYASVQVAGWRLFTRLAREIDVLLDLPVLAQRLLSLLCSDLDVSGASLSLLTPGGEALQVVAWEGQPVLLPVGSVVPRGKGLPWVAIEAGATFSTADVAGHPRYVGRQDGERGAGVYLPLVADAGVQGVLALYRPWPQTFGVETRAYLEAIAVPIAEMLAISRLHADLARAVRVDSLTQAASRQEGLSLLDAACTRAARTGQACAVVMLDLNGFKQVNDRFGHQVGDAVLREVTLRLRRLLLPGDVLARYGGDEFLLVISGEGLSGLDQLLARLLAPASAGVIVAYGQEVPLPTWAAGMALCPTDGREPAELLRVADARLYQRKSPHAPR